MWRVLGKTGRAGQSVLIATDRWFEPAADVILRVPSLVLLDYCWRFELDDTLLNRRQDQFGVFNTIMAVSLLLQAIAVLLLPLEYVVRLYMHYISGAVLVLSHQFSFYHISNEATQPAGPGLAAFFHVVPVWWLWTQPPGGDPANSSFADSPSAALPVQFLRRQLAAIAVHMAAAAVVIVLLEVEDTRRRVSLLAHAVPVVALMANMASGVELLFLHNCASAVTILSCLTWLIGCVPACVEYYHQLYLKYYFHATMVFDSGQMARQLWRALFSPRLFLCYWLCLALTQVHHLYLRSSALPTSRALSSPHLFALTVLAATTASPLSLVSFCVTGGYASWAAVRLLKRALKAPAERRADHSGWIEAGQMLLLSMQVDLIHQELPARLALIAVVLFVALTSTGQTIYEVAESAVLALSASGSRSLPRHLSVLLTCLTLVALPVRLTVLLFGLFGFDLWVLVLGSSALTLTLQAVGLLVIHGVCLFDTLRREPWHRLDGVVYAARAAASVAQLLVALLVVSTGVYESARGHWSWASAAILMAHGYFNVWRRLRDGWTQFMLRRAAAHTASTLPPATELQIRDYGDVCAICYSAMSEARQLQCRHMFHSMCLRRWLYVQNTCPMCQTAILVQTEEKRKEKDGDGGSDEGGGEVVAHRQAGGDRDGQDKAVRKETTQMGGGDSSVTLLGGESATITDSQSQEEGPGQPPRETSEMASSTVPGISADKPHTDSNVVGDTRPGILKSPATVSPMAHKLVGECTELVPSAEPAVLTPSTSNDSNDSPIGRNTSGYTRSSPVKCRVTTAGCPVQPKPASSTTCPVSANPPSSSISSGEALRPLTSGAKQSSYPIEKCWGWSKQKSTETDETEERRDEGIDHGVFANENRSVDFSGGGYAGQEYQGDGTQAESRFDGSEQRPVLTRHSDRSEGEALCRRRHHIADESR